VQYVLPGLVLVTICVAVAAWMKAAGGDDGVAEAEFVDVTRVGDVPATFGAPARHAVATVSARRVPLVAIRSGPRLGQGWLHFADGTELLAEERVLGVLGLLAVDLAWRGPVAALTITATADDCWATVGRRNTRLRLLDGHHPEALTSP
jgi:hypothetical protein